MHCEDARLALGPDLGPRSQTPELTQALAHVDGCTDCRAFYAGQAALRARLRRLAGGTHAPEALRLRVATALRQEQARRRRAGRVGLLAVGGGLVAAAALILLLTRGGGVERLAAPLAAQAAIGLAGPDAMATSDLAALQRWFEGRLDYGVPVPAITGATLAGGRVVELDGQRAAAVVYWFHEQPVTYFPMPSGEVMGKSVPWEGIASASAGGYEVAVWREGSLARAVAAPMPRDDVMRIAAECRAKALMAS